MLEYRPSEIKEKAIKLVMNGTTRKDTAFILMKAFPMFMHGQRI